MDSITKWNDLGSSLLAGFFVFYMPIKDTIVDQRGISDRWISLGVYQFGRWPAAPWLGVWVSDSTGESPSSLRHLAVDAIRFRTPWPVYIPVVLKNY